MPACRIFRCFFRPNPTAFENFSEGKFLLILRFVLRKNYFAKPEARISINRTCCDVCLEKDLLPQTNSQSKSAIKEQLKGHPLCEQIRGLINGPNSEILTVF